jgi:WD40 repeat protein
VRVWDLSGGQCRATLTGNTGRVFSATLTEHTGMVYGMSFSADGRTDVYVGRDATVHVYDRSSGQRKAIHEFGSPEADSAWALARSAARLRFEKSAHTVALVSSTGDVLARFPGQFSAAAFLEDGRHGLAWDGSRQVYLLRLHRREG